jgi:hypothetical protein
MKNGSNYGDKHQRFSDQIIGEKIVLYDDSNPGYRVIREITIINNEGEKRDYCLKKTNKGRYLIN